MKKFIYFAVISSVLWSCGGGGGDEPTPPPAENKAPSTPTLVAPTNNLLCIDNVLTFQWNASTDPESDPITYLIDIAKDNMFTQIIHATTSTTTSKIITLEKGIAYYWRVRARDSKSANSEYSSTFNFYTEGVGITNHLPFSPSLISPQLNAVAQVGSVVLEWNASDADTADVLSYDVYFDTVNPPVTKVATDASAKTHTITTTAGNDYYWKVVVKDNKGGLTIGQIWNFKTD